ncbi:hypothetical protein BKA70DRAFT_1448355 [Coprinopsis sp. MPI-PUGE-AT-0042]|nr:hypothetical protein BKA70DRAFT_1448355 [Coprinopsis sp. MPI-PUGE-AT-0042]
MVSPSESQSFRALGDLVRDPQTREALTPRENLHPWRTFLATHNNLPTGSRCEEMGKECWNGDEAVGCVSCSKVHQICSNATRLQETMLRIKFDNSVESSESSEKFMREFLILENTATGSSDRTWNKIKHIDKALEIPGEAAEWAKDYSRVLHVKMKANELRQKSVKNLLEHIRGCAIELQNQTADPDHNGKDFVAGLARIEDLAKTALGVEQL